MDLAERAEAEAAGGQAEIYAGIRRLGGVPMVALIFRHLATLPGALEWMWSAVEPAWRSGHLQEAAWGIAREVSLEPLVPMPRAALAAMGMDDAALEEVDSVFRAYNRANPVNLLTVLCLLRLAPGRQAVAPVAARSWSPPPPPGPIPPMGDLRSQPDAVNALLQLVAGPAPPAGGARVVQSLYRHFLHRPAFLALAVTLLRPRYEDGTADAAVGRVRAAMADAADAIVQGLSAPPAPHAGIVPVCTRFSGDLIPRMIVAGRLLEEAMPDR